MIEEILKKYRRIAVIGFSADPEKPGRKVPKFLLSRGYTIFPVNPNLEEALGLKVYRNLMEIPDTVEIVEVFRLPKYVPEVIEEAIQRRKQRGDVYVIWLQEGIRHDEAAKKAEQAGITVIQDKCMYKEYMKWMEFRKTPGA
ncbi:MAG: CoA-binding protein [bacterium JZ-2024 1]